MSQPQNTRASCPMDWLYPSRPHWTFPREGLHLPRLLIHIETRPDLISMQVLVPAPRIQRPQRIEELLSRPPSLLRQAWSYLYRSAGGEHLHLLQPQIPSLSSLPILQVRVTAPLSPPSELLVPWKTSIPRVM